MVKDKQLLSPRIDLLWLIVTVSFLVLIFVFFTQKLSLDLEVEKEFRISFIDVGQGDAALVQAGSQEMLIDGGRNRDVLFGLGSLMPFWDRQIKYVIATHPDADHIGGLVSVLNCYQVDQVIDNAEVVDNQVYQGYVDAVVNNGAKYQTADSLRAINLSPETTITLFPTNFSNDDDRNERSLITRIDHNSFSALLTGDASIEVEEQLIDRYPGLLNVDVLKLGHHGSKTSTSLEFLQATTPKYVIISAPEDSQYGHPHREVINNMIEYGQAEIFYTGTDGFNNLRSRAK